MRVLAVACESPTPVRDGFTLRVDGLLTALARRHDVHLVTYGGAVDVPNITTTVLDGPPEPALAQRLGWAAFGLITGEPAIVRRFRLGGITAAARRALERGRFDVVHLAGNDAAFFALDPAVHGSIPTVVDLVDAWHPYLQEEARAPGWAPKLQILTVPTVRRYERAVLAAATAAVVVADRDQQALRRLAHGARIEVIPNGVDTHRFSPAPEVTPQPGLLVFHGAMDYGPNIEAATFLVREVLPRVQRVAPSARVRLVGRRPATSVLALAGPNVEVTGEVDDVRPWIAGSEVAVCPMLRGAGIKNKVLEAAALGVPLVLTPSAVGDIALVDGRDVMVASTADELAGAITTLLSDDAARGRLAAAARHVIIDRYGWDAVADTFTQLYHRAVAGREDPSA